jgi:flagellar protein FlaG
MIIPIASHAVADYSPARSAPADIQRTAAVPTADGIAQATAQQPDLAQIREAVGRINDTVQSLVGQLEFSIDTDTRRTVVKVVDIRTKQVLRQFPSEEVLQIAKALDNFTGLLLREKA